eukprot:330553-Prymnesium_polylepis.1
MVEYEESAGAAASEEELTGRQPIYTRPDGTPYAVWSFGVLHITNPVRQRAIRVTQWSSAPRLTACVKSEPPY